MAFNLFPQTDFRQMDLNYVLEVSKQAAANLEEYAADKEQVVATQAAAERALAAAQEDIETARQAATSASQDAQTASGAAGTATQAAASAEHDAQTASAAAERAEQVQESIPADYTDLSNQVSDLKSDFNELDDIINGDKNYIENKKLITSGTGQGTLADDDSYDTTALIPLSLIASGTTITVDYGTIPESTIFALYNSDGIFLDSWVLNASATSRQFTLSYTSYTDPTFVRFSFQHGYSASLKDQFGANTYWTRANNGGLVSDVENLQTEVSDLPTKCMVTDTYLDYAMQNRLDPSACEIGYYMAASGVKYESESYFLTDYMPIKSGETLWVFRTDTNEKKRIRFFTAFDADKNVLSALGSNAEVDSVTQSGGMAFVRCTIPYTAGDYGRLPEYTACLATEEPEYIPAFENNPVFKSEYTRKKVRVYSTDTEAEVITKLVDAYNIGNCDVVFDRATYTFGTELVKVATDYGMKWCEIPIGNNCRYYFNGSTLIANIDLSQLTPEIGDDEFYCNFFGCQRKPSSYEMHDGVLSATDTRYVVHDESSALVGTYKHLYQNMEMHYHTNTRTESIRKCIGGGTGASGVVEIIGCKFTTDAVDACVSYHGNGQDVIGAEFDINVRDNWFSNGIRGGELSANQTARLFYTGNSAATEPMTYDRWTVTKFLNEVR